MPGFSISHSPFNTEPLRAALMDARAGAFATFEGIVRNCNAGRPVSALRYQTYQALAEAEGGRIVAEACARFPILAARCVHRVGELAIGDLAVWVGVSAGHRDAAFAACRYIIDEVKARVPIWKCERYADGSADWLHPDSIDAPEEARHIVNQNPNPPEKVAAPPADPGTRVH